jgi:hypothetical protein
MPRVPVAVCSTLLCSPLWSPRIFCPCHIAQNQQRCWIGAATDDLTVPYGRRDQHLAATWRGTMAWQFRRDRPDILYALRSRKAAGWGCAGWGRGRWICCLQGMR